MNLSISLPQIGELFNSGRNVTWKEKLEREIDEERFYYLSETKDVRLEFRSNTTGEESDKKDKKNKRRGFKANYAQGMCLI